MKRGKTNAKRKPLAVAVEPVVGSLNDLVPHTPRNHAKHTLTCGCWVDGKSEGRKTVCAFCGAAYEWAEVYSFQYFICYDCGNIVGTKPGTSNPAVTLRSEAEVACRGVVGSPNQEEA